MSNKITKKQVDKALAEGNTDVKFFNKGLNKRLMKQQKIVERAQILRDAQIKKMNRRNAVTAVAEQTSAIPIGAQPFDEVLTHHGILGPNDASVQAAEVYGGEPMLYGADGSFGRNEAGYNDHPMDQIIDPQTNLPAGGVKITDQFSGMGPIVEIVDEDRSSNTKMRAEYFREPDERAAEPAGKWRGGILHSHPVGVVGPTQHSAMLAVLEAQLRSSSSKATIVSDDNLKMFNEDMPQSDAIRIIAAEKPSGSMYANIARALRPYSASLSDQMMNMDAVQKYPGPFSAFEIDSATIIIDTATDNYESMTQHGLSVEEFCQKVIDAMTPIDDTEVARYDSTFMSESGDEEDGIVIEPNALKHFEFKKFDPNEKFNFSDEERVKLRQVQEQSMEQAHYKPFGPYEENLTEDQSPIENTQKGNKDE